VAINYFRARSPDGAEVIALIKAEKRIGLAIPGDLRDEAFCHELVTKAVEGFGGLDIVVNNAGRQQTHASILDISTEQFDWTMKTNIYAPFWIIKAALPHLKPGLSIIGTTSEQAYDPSPELYDYAQTKAATMNYVKSLAKQLDPKGIRVNGVAPGPMDAPAGKRRCNDGEPRKGRRANALWKTGPARRVCFHICPVSCGRCELRNRPGLRRRGWRWSAIGAQPMRIRSLSLRPVSNGRPITVARWTSTTGHPATGRRWRFGANCTLNCAPVWGGSARRAFPCFGSCAGRAHVGPSIARIRLATQ
jgi:NAD(P)-dependent dehydrogenase (short-subunit alcohol dehydrogenase family)